MDNIKINRGGLPLLLTASVSTRGMKGALFTDEERENMYVGALKFYLEQLPKEVPYLKIVFAENSGWDLSRLRRMLEDMEAIDCVEWIALPAEDFDVSRGKGFNEMQLMKMAVEQSTFIRQAGAFMKATGRYPIRNMGRLLRAAAKAIGSGRCSLYCDIKDHKLYDILSLGWEGHSFDCRLWAVTSDRFMKEIAPLQPLVDDYGAGDLLEGVLFKYVKSSSKEGMCVRFPREPIYAGIEGSVIDAVSFTPQQDGFGSKLKRLVGNGIRIFMPWFYF